MAKSKTFKIVRHATKSTILEKRDVAELVAPLPTIPMVSGTNLGTYKKVTVKLGL
jgi:hypothetical protein